MGLGINVCKGEGLSIEDNYLAGLTRLYREELSSTNCFKANISENQKVYNFFIIYNKKTNNIAKYLTNIDKFSIIYCGKWQIWQKSLKIT